MEKEFITGLKLVFLENKRDAQKDVKQFLVDKVLPDVDFWKENMEANTLSNQFVVNGVVLPKDLQFSLNNDVSINLNFDGKCSIEQDYMKNVPGKVNFSYHIEGERPYQTNFGNIDSYHVNISRKLALNMDGYALVQDLLDYGIPVEVRETERVSVNDKGEIKVLLSDERPDLVGKTVGKTGNDYIRFDIQTFKSGNEDLNKWARDALQEVKKNALPNYKEATTHELYGIVGVRLERDKTITRLFKQKNGGQIMLETVADSKGKIKSGRLIGVVPVNKVNKIFTELGNKYGTFVKNWQTKHPKDAINLDNVGKEALKDDEFKLDWVSKKIRKPTLKKKTVQKEKTKDIGMELTEV